MGWIVVRNWDRFQHYGDRRSPPWIKLYLALLHDEGFQELTPEQRSALMSLWILYAITGRKVRDNTSKLSKATGQRFTKRTLEALVNAGFIDISASAPASAPLALVEEEKRREVTAAAFVSRPPAREAPADDEQEEEKTELDTLLETLEADQALAARARQEPERATACAKIALNRNGISNRGAYFRRLLDSATWPTQITEPPLIRTNVQPADPRTAIETMIRNGVIADEVELEAEIDGYRLDEWVAAELRGLLDKVGP